MSYAARVPSLAEAEAEVIALWRRNRAATLPHEAMFRWYYQATPTPPSQCVLVDRKADAEGPATSVGMIGIGTRPLKLDRSTISSGLLGDLVIDKSHRSLFPVLTLVRGATAWAQARYALLYGFPNALSQPVFKRLGFHTVAPLTRYVFVLRHASYLQSRLENEPKLTGLGRARSLIASKAAARLAAIPVDGWRRLVAPGYSRPLPSGHVLRRVAQPGAEFDRLLGRCDYRPLLCGLRSAAFLRWRFLTRPDEDVELQALYREGELLGYAAVHRAGSLVHIRDLCAGSLDELSLLLGALSAAMRRAGHSALSFLGHGPAGFIARLNAFGFSPRGDGHPLITLPGSHWPAGDERYADPQNWLVTEADEDQ